MSLADVSAWASVITGLIAVTALLGSFPTVARFVLQSRIGRAKAPVSAHLRRTALRRGTRSRARRAHRAQARAIATGAFYTAADELQWLTDTLCLDRSFSFDETRRGHFEALASCYRRYATSLRLRNFLFGGGQPILDRVADVADRTADILGVNADHQGVAPGRKGRTAVATCQVTTGYVSQSRGADHEVPSLIHLERLEIDGRHVDHYLQVSWLQELSRQPRPPAVPGAEPREYNGLLPRLLGHRYERDLSTGNYRLHVELGEIYYADYRKVSRPRPAACDPGAGAGPSLLTISVLPVTRDGHVVLAQRGGLSVYPGCWGPGAGGNLEIFRPGRPNPDVDPHGVIDPLRAIAREAREEIGLELDPERVHPLGLARLANSEEYGTWLLPTMAPLSLTLEELARATAGADAVNGRWEVGRYLAAVPVPQDQEAAENLLSWALHNEQAMPHLTASLVLLTSSVSDTGLLPHAVTPRPSDDRPLPPGALRFRVGEDIGPANGLRQD